MNPFGRARDGRIAVRLPADGIRLLRRVTDELRAMLADPDDSALRRLFPRAYADDDAEAAFAAMTRSLLVEGKRGKLAALTGILEHGREHDGWFETALDDDGVNAWLGSITDARLVLGTLLDVTEDDQPFPLLAPDDPRASVANAYLWLGAVSEALLDVLLQELPDDDGSE